MSKQIPLRISEQDLKELDATIASGRYPNRSAALRAALELLLAHERERLIEEAYRSGYGRHPQEDWIGETSLALLAASVEAEERGQEPL